MMCFYEKESKERMNEFLVSLAEYILNKANWAAKYIYLFRRKSEVPHANYMSFVQTNEEDN